MTLTGWLKLCHGFDATVNCAARPAGCWVAPLADVAGAPELGPGETPVNERAAAGTCAWDEWMWGGVEAGGGRQRLVAVALATSPVCTEIPLARLDGAF